ncbi:MAG: Arc family DNA-binding protein [Gammaproteobacteria bacterium]|nr:Arc family DNA-binding protein [Gammaproteobacteria bacterium]
MATQKTMTFGDVQKTALRLPRPLHSQILRAAEENGRTMNAEIVARLTASFEEADDGLFDRLKPDQRLVVEQIIKLFKYNNNQ